MSAADRLPATPSTGAASTTARRGGRRRELAISSASVAVLLGLWQASATLRWVDPLFTSSPADIVAAFGELIQEGTLWPALVESGRLFLAGFAVSVVAALPAGMLLGWYRPLAAVFDPILQVLYVTPRIALIPVVVIWSGVGFQSKLTIVVLTAFFPLLINTIAGVRAVDQSLLRVARSFLARDLDVFRTLALPSAAPFVVSGLKLSMTMALIGMVVAEYFIGSDGLGGLITTAGISLRADRAFAGVALVAGFALLLNAALGRVEQRLGRWRMHS